MKKQKRERVVFNYGKLLGKIKECFGKQAIFAEAMGLSERSVSLKLNGIRCWTQNEMLKFCDIIGMSYTEIPNYFFVVDVKN
jgi:hypothetical protein